MAFINVEANFSLLVGLFHRIAVALERLAGPEHHFLTPEGKKRGPESIVKYGDQERQWAKEFFLDEIHRQGFPKEREGNLLNVALKRWDYERKHSEPTLQNFEEG